MKRAVGLGLALAFAAMELFLAGCDSDIYSDTKACRDNDDLTQCSADPPEQVTDAKQTNMKVQK
jgi:hypothetical protein